VAPRCVFLNASNDLMATMYAQVKNMIGNQLCAGVRNVEDGVLVSWCLTYPDGSMGVLYTHQVPPHRLVLLFGNL
jgi:hypothetical protein